MTSFVAAYWAAKPQAITIKMQMATVKVAFLFYVSKFLLADRAPRGNSVVALSGKVRVRVFHNSENFKSGSPINQRSVKPGKGLRCASFFSEPEAAH
jgi:hypothetical protein